MKKETKIQWCDDTVNPAMGCDGCPLHPTPDQVRGKVLELLVNLGVPSKYALDLIAGTCSGHDLTDLYLGRKKLARILADKCECIGIRVGTRQIERQIAEAVRCYAATLHLRWSSNGDPNKRGNPGFAARFEEVTLFAGRTQKIATLASLAYSRRLEKPWLDGQPRLIFVSDMGDALSRQVPFEYLKQEIVDVADSAAGRQHVWLWLTKRPRRMAQFSKWLTSKGKLWPDNLVPMTSVIDRTMTKQIKYLREIPAKVRGLSVEPLWEGVELDLEGIDWVIVGGESGAYAKPFDLAWARMLRDSCTTAGTAFFLKQLGKRPVDNGIPLVLADGHGGDWAEWPEDLRIRQCPSQFLDLVIHSKTSCAA